MTGDLFKILKMRDYLRFLLLNILVGGVNFAFLSFINFLMNRTVLGEMREINFTYIGAFVVIIAVFLLSRRALSLQIIRFSQHFFWSLRKEILQLIANAKYGEMSTQKDKITAALVGDVNVLSAASVTLIYFSSSLVVTVFCLIYLAGISWILFAITICVIVAGAMIYLSRNKYYSALLKLARQRENEFVSYFNMMMGGHKEILINRAKGKDIYDRKIVPVAELATEQNTIALNGYLNNQIIGRTLLYCLIGIILLLVAVIFKLPSTAVVNYLVVLLFLRVEIENIMSSFPAIVQGKVAAERVMQLKNDLAPLYARNLPADPDAAVMEFESLSLRGVEFSYNGGFKVGPVNLDVNKGDIIFIYGGNGSGKTTLMFLLLGLLGRSAGTTSVNGQCLKDDEYESFLRLYAVVFSDFYLFDEFYGINDLDEEKLSRYLHLFQMESKVSFQKNKYSATNLSTGQRKRLAIIAALMEGRQILLLDEWAADQDPFFRKKFYTQILPALKEEGITIVAITHDDKYYSCADRIYKMEEGRLSHEILQKK
ncbi:cyclic peptide export ABC transporter [Chitinophaga sp. S165]|uniref:cyclic peptide export ABC transporter n=1 Tax=Chitinophaga sp. S165 TaxID=2135462 RepID=UPI000D713093|nr:cyclic peptide export ABC transporter [Chitinophaga sp. S165]PWV46109.1 putative ATP-binding cassette transporter [Chitinophaga sp. S165]